MHFKFFSDDFTCPGFYKCHSSQICINLGDRCNGKRECPQGDDEWLCDTVCPLGCQCHGLTYFCVGSGWNTLPDILSTEVRKLVLSNNSLALDNSTFANFLWLGELYLAANGISELQRLCFGDLYNLYILDLSYNNIVVMLPQIFVGLHNLRTLILVGNKNLRFISHGTFQGLDQLPSLSIQNALISNLAANTFAGLQNLQKLDLSYNRILDVNVRAFAGLDLLSNLTMVGNPDTIMSPKALAALISLQYLATDSYKHCCFVKTQVSEDNCLPAPDEFSSCEDLMRRSVLKAFLWILGLMAFICNIFVIVWRGQEKMNVYSFCVINLAVADFFMGLYMVVLASVDVHYMGEYIEHADAWRHSMLCSLLGVCNTISAEASVFTLCVISADRFYKIVFPLHGARFNLKKAKLAMAGVWALSIILAVIPLFPISYFNGEYYSRSSVCLSLHITNETPAGWEYSVAVFHGVNFTSFVFIFLSYSYIFYEVRKSKRATSKFTQGPSQSEVALARRLILVVATDFLCWVPINIMGNVKI